VTAAGPAEALALLADAASGDGDWTLWRVAAGGPPYLVAAALGVYQPPDAPGPTSSPGVHVFRRAVECRTLR
jgi:hypothetical protein